MQKEHNEEVKQNVDTVRCFVWSIRSAGLKPEGDKQAELDFHNGRTKVNVGNRC